MTLSIRDSVLAISVAGVVSCSSVAPTTSGFLSDYQGLAAVDDEDVLVAFDESAPWGAFDTFVLEPVEFLRGGDQVAESVGPELATRFEAALVEALASTWDVAAVPEPNTIRVRAVVTAAEPVLPVVNVFSLLLLWIPVDNGGASVELEMRTPGGDVVYAVSAARTGRLLQFWKGVVPYSYARWSLDSLAAQIGRDVAEQVERSRGAGAAP